MLLGNMCLSCTKQILFQDHEVKNCMKMNLGGTELMNRFKYFDNCMYYLISLFLKFTTTNHSPIYSLWPYFAKLFYACFILAVHVQLTKSRDFSLLLPCSSGKYLSRGSWIVDVPQSMMPHQEKNRTLFFIVKLIRFKAMMSSLPPQVSDSLNFMLQK